MALLVLAAAAAVTLLCPWVRARGSRVPDTAELDEAELARAGVSEALTASGASTLLGAVLLVLACVLAAVALWRYSPRYRPAAAGYLVIVCSLAAAGATLWFLLDPARQAAAFSGEVLLEADTVTVTAWPWLCLVCFGLACIPGILLVPPRSTAAAP